MEDEDAYILQPDQSQAEQVTIVRQRQCSQIQTAAQPSMNKDENIIRMRRSMRALLEFAAYEHVAGYRIAHEPKNDDNGHVDNTEMFQ